MADSASTKRALGESLKELMQATPLSKISVGDITTHCGINRQTFYYHFKDKYDLVSWVYYTETRPYMTALSDRAHWAEGLCQICHYLRNNKKFYINALNTPGQNSFEEILTDFAHNLIRSLLDELKGDKIVSEKDLEFIANFYSLAFVAVIVKWAQHGMREDPDYYIYRIQDLVDGNMVRELEHYNSKKTS